MPAQRTLGHGRDATNCDSSRPATGDGVGFEFQDGRQPLVMPLPLNGPVSLPQTLNDGAEASFFFDLAQLERAEAEVGQRIRGAFVAASGERHRGPFVKR
jgi:hypothetical protein